MQSDTAHADDHPAPHADPLDGTAAVSPVTDAMMDHAAHGAAALADSVAQGTAVLDRATDQAADLSERAAAAAGETNRAVERGTEAARESASAAADALSQYNAKVMEIVRSNFASTTELFAALVQAKSVPEAMSLNADHLRRQMETLTSQGRDLATLAQRIALDAMQPFKGVVDR